VEYLIKQYPLESGALEIQYIEEYFGEFPRRKTAHEILDRLTGRESLILMAEAPLPDDPGSLVPVSYKVVHEIRGHENVAKLRDLVERLRGYVDFQQERVLFRALTEESESWAIAQGFNQIVVKTKNRYYDMRAVLAQLQFNVVKFERHETDGAESKVYLGKPLPADLVRDHRSIRTVVQAD
jgi:hypothetical protein